MTTYYTTEYDYAFVDDPVTKVDVSKQHGRLRVMYASITLSAELAVDDVIKIGKLPAHARVFGGKAVLPDDGTSGIVNIGWLSNGTDAADPDGLFIGASEVDFGAGAIDVDLAGTAAGFGKKFSAETTVQAVCTEASNASSGNTFEFLLYYVVD
jgi:hypothetical protein